MSCHAEEENKKLFMDFKGKVILINNVIFMHVILALNAIP